MRSRFEREARTISSLNHPHICTLHDVGREGDTDYLVMELIEGETLAHRLARGRLPTAEVLRLGAPSKSPRLVVVLTIDASSSLLPSAP